MNLKNRSLPRFLRNVLWDMEIIISETNIINYSNDKLYDKFLKQLNMFSQALGPMYRSDFDAFFTSVEIKWNNLHSLLNSHCSSKIIKEFTNVFLILMYAYSFAFSLIDFCRRRTGHRRFSLKVSLFMERVFIYEIKHWFYAQGGWNGLASYCSAQKLLQVLDFINVCYSEKGKLLTFVKIESHQPDLGKFKGDFHDFGIHSERTLTLLRYNLEDFESYLLATYEEELRLYPCFTFMLKISILRMYFALDWTARDLNPSEAASILTRPLLDYFEDYLKKLQY